MTPTRDRLLLNPGAAGRLPSMPPTVSFLSYVARGNPMSGPHDKAEAMPHRRSLLEDIVEVSWERPM
jgi:hypothetical protein